MRGIWGVFKLCLCLFACLEYLKTKLLIWGRKESHGVTSAFQEPEGVKSAVTSRTRQCTNAHRPAGTQRTQALWGHTGQSTAGGPWFQESPCLPCYPAHVVSPQWWVVRLAVGAQMLPSDHGMGCELRGIFLPTAWAPSQCLLPLVRQSDSCTWCWSCCSSCRVLFELPFAG